MGVLIDGKWRDEELPQETGRSGEFRRSDSIFRQWVTADGSSGFKAEAGRYHLYVAYGCPWAHRTLIYRAVKKLEPAITVAYAVPGIKEQGWTFEKSAEFPDCLPDTIEGFHYLHEAYTASEPTYTGKVTVPTLWDRRTRRVVNNESSEIIRMLNSEFKGIAGDDTDFYPPHLRAEIDRINERVYANVNNGVYRCGFARSQQAYEAAYDSLFETLDELEARLGRQRYLVGDQITEADWRLFPTLVRFDVAYFSLFKCNRQRIADFPNLLNYMRALYRIPGVAATVTPRQYIANYWSIKRVNPTGIIPKGTPVDYIGPRSGNPAPGFAAKPDHRVDLVRDKGQRARVVFAGITIADSVDALTVKETAHDPVLYFPRKDVRMDMMSRTEHHTYCPYKGNCSYFTLAANGRTAENAVWSYEAPYDEVTGLKDYVAFYRTKVDAVTVEPAG